MFILVCLGALVWLFLRLTLYEFVCLIDYLLMYCVCDFVFDYVGLTCLLVWVLLVVSGFSGLVLLERSVGWAGSMLIVLYKSHGRAPPDPPLFLLTFCFELCVLYLFIYICCVVLIVCYFV